MATNAQKNLMIKLVVGLFDAAPGKMNLTDLLNAIDDGVTFPQVADILDSIGEFTYGIINAKTGSQQVAEMMNHFELTYTDGTPDPATAAGQAQIYFAARRLAGDDWGEIILDSVTFLSLPSTATDPLFADTVTFLNNKTAVAEAFSNFYDAPLVPGNYVSNVKELQKVLAGVTLDMDTPEEQSAYLESIGYPVSPGGVFTLTNGTDIASANIFQAPLVYTPGGDDRINSLQDEDVLTGTGTNPTLNATLGNANDNGGVVITPTLNGVETVNAAFTGSGGAFFAVSALDLQDATGVAAVNITRVSQAVDFAEVGNLQDPASALSLANTNANQAGVVEFSYAAGVLAGENTGNLAIDDVQIGALNVGENTSFINAAGVGNNSFEQLTLTSTGNNVVGVLDLPMDTGTAGTLTIEGSGSLRLGGRGNVVNNNNAALVEAANIYFAGTGIAQAGGRIAAINASGFGGDLTLVLDNILDVGKADTSGVDQDVTVTGGTGNDTFVLYDAVQEGDSIIGGEGDDNLLFYSGSSLSSAAAGIETATMFADGSTGNINLDMDFLPDVTGITARNISHDEDGGPGEDVDTVVENSANAATTFTLRDLTVDQAANITVQHATTFNNQITNTVIEAAIAANTANDTLGVTIAEGTNVDPRFNFTIDTAVANNATSTAAASSTFENVTLTDDDTESNSVELSNFGQHTATITLTGGQAGDFLNLDVDTAGADVTAGGVLDGGTNVAGATLDGGQVQQGLLGIDTDGTGVDATAGHFFDVSGVTTQVRLGAATIDASGMVADVILRVSTNAASAVGAQTITTGTGDDTVIFDNINDSRSGLTISDTVNGGAGDDTLVIDGGGVRISLGASEWTNVSNFETLQIVGTSAAPVSTLLGQNAYNLTLTNDLIAKNGQGMLHIVNDNDANNDQSGVSTGTFYPDTAGTAVESGVTLDARSLNAQAHFSYNGEEGATRTADRFIFADANINGGNVIDGGAVDNLSDTNSPANADIMEVRNLATVTAGDLQGVSNIGTIAGVNDQAVAQTLDLELTDGVIDALVDSYHVATTTEVETVNVRMNDAADIAAPVAGMGLTLDATGMSGSTAAVITLDGGFAVTDAIKLGHGLLNVSNFVIGGEDHIQLSVSEFGLTLDDDDIGLIALTDTAVDGTNIVFGGLGVTAGVVTDRIIFEDTGVDTNVYFDSDGSGAGAQVLIATIVGGTGLLAADVDIVA